MSRKALLALALAVTTIAVAQVKIADTSIALAGTLTDPLNLGALDLRLKLAGASLGNLYPLTGVTLPDSPAYSTDGHLIAKLHEASGASFTYENFNGKIGNSDIHGNLAYVAGCLLSPPRAFCLALESAPIKGARSVISSWLDTSAPLSLGRGWLET